METRQRTLIKALCWQATGLVVMAAVGWALTGSAALGGTFAAINGAIGLLTYVAHERIWAHVRWGRG